MPFTTLTLGGGGSKGIFHVGILLELQKHQELVFPEGVYGVSVGSIIATYLAFGLPISRQELDKFTHLFSPLFFIEEVDFPKLAQSVTSKGLFTTDHFCRGLVDVFAKYSIDLKTARISDAKMPLYILASNLTKGKPTIFSGDVLVIDAIRCSCAIPGIFQPQILYDQVYVDGDMFCPSLDYFLKDKENALSISLKCGMIENQFTPSKLESMSPFKYMHDIYTLVTRNFHSQTKGNNTVMVSFPNFHATSDLKDFNLEDILQKCSETLHSFLSSKNLL
jgi:predicted acylesterase/phospholipase RssA